MKRYILYSNDVKAACFDEEHSLIKAYTPLKPELLPMQIRKTSPEGFMAWLRDRSIDLNTLLHRNMVNDLLGCRDKLTLALMTRMFSISDCFTCFPEGEFIPRNRICAPEEQEFFSEYILISGDTSLRARMVASPNISTDGSFPKTWRYENGGWWLYKLQSAAATRSEVEISRVLNACKWDAAGYEYVGHYRKRVKTRNFLKDGEFFEPYDSFRYFFDDTSDDDEVIARNIASLGEGFALAWERILLADAFFMNTDRHMRNFGVIRSALDGSVLRLAPNFDNNQAFTANPSGVYSDAMLRMYMRGKGCDVREMLRILCEHTAQNAFLSAAAEAGEKFLNS